MVTENKFYTWVEPKLIIQKSPDNKISYLLYNFIQNFKVKNDAYKIVKLEASLDKSTLSNYILDYRIEYVKYLKNLYPDSYSTDAGFSAMIDAIKSYKDNLIMLYKNFEIVGALSYDINDKKRIITINHIGVINRMRGYGSTLMNELYNVAKVIDYKISVTSNGYADDFYKFCGMIRVVDKPLGIYTIQPDNMMNIAKLQHGC